MKRRTKNCYSERPYERTEYGLCYRIFYDQCKSSKMRKHPEPEYTKDELAIWIKSQDNFINLYNDWVQSNYTSDLRPSCDRLDNSLGYSFTNIELITWKENQLRANIDTISGTIGSSQVKVFQYNIDGSFKKEYKSMSLAAKAESIFDQRNISSCCRNLIPTAYKYYWSYTFLGNNIEPIISQDSFMKEIFQYDPITKEIVNIYNTILEIPRSKYHYGQIRRTIQGKQIIHNNYYWSTEYLSPDQIHIDMKYIPKIIEQRTLDGILIATFKSMTEASKVTNTGSGNISKCCNNKAKTANGYKWCYSATSLNL